ncbi:MAG: CHAD domain-containing protein [Acidobacteria bacterium]|nr:CHAD domain-containing protein [Acidobacteriota bacterium]
MIWVGKETRPFNVLDSYDGSLLQSGSLLLEFPEKEATAELLPKRIEARLDGPLPRNVFETDFLPDGALRKIVQGRAGAWRLRVCARGMETAERYRIENEDRKGVARLQLRRLKCRNSPAVIDVRLGPYRGYGRDTAPIRALLEEIAPFPEATALFRSSLPASMRSLMKPPPEVRPDQGDRTAVSDLARYILDRVRHFEPGVVEDEDPEILHQYRVSLRRMRSLTALLKQVFTGQERETIRVCLKQAMQITNRLRDLDVQINEVRALGPSIPDALQTGLDQIMQRLRGERELEFQSVRKRLEAAEFEARFGPVSAILDENKGPVPKKISDLLAPAILKRYQKIAQDTAKIEGEIKPNQLHGLRVSFKKLRYLVDFFPQLLCRDPVKPLLKDLKKLQTLLGRYNDLCVLEALLLGQARQHPGDSAALMTLGAIIMQAHQKRDRLAGKSIAAVRDFCSEERGDLLPNLLGGSED